MKLDRTKNSLRNIIWGIFNMIIMLFFPFILRTILIQSLGVEYLGLNSLFISIFTVLNLAELGFSNAVVFCMYKPIAENDEDTICALMGYYRRVYHIIGGIVLLVGVLLIPFLPCFVKGGYPSDINIVGLYLLFLANTSVSYFLFAYKNCILTAYQRQDVLSKVNIVLKIMMYGCQVVALLVFKNYYLYIVTSVVNTILTSIITAHYSRKIYPQYICRGEIKKDKKKLLKKSVQGLMIGKVCMVSRNSFDSIFLSIFMGLKTVAIYGNYYYIMSAVGGILTMLMISLSAGIGNSVATESIEKNYHDMNKFIFIYAWIAGWCATCLFCLFTPFMILWMGYDMLFPPLDVMLMCLYFYFLTMGDVRSQYSSAVGLFWESKNYVLVETILNLALNYLLGKLMGVHGILIATLISILFINFGWGSRIVFKYYFKQFNVTEFYKKHIVYFVVIVIVAVCTYCIVDKVPGEGIISFVIKILMCIVVPNALFAIFYFKTKEFKNSVLFFKNILKKAKASEETSNDKHSITKSLTFWKNS